MSCLHNLPGRASLEAALDQLARAPQQRDQAPDRAHRHLPKRGGHRPPARRAILLEQNDEWPVQRSRYLSLESFAPLSDNLLISLPILAA
jgi:hypothetical protein